MAEFWTSYGLPLALIVAQSVALLVILLLIVAFLLYADRKVWAAVQMRRGPNVVGPWGLVAVLRRSAEIRVQGADHSGRRQ